MKKKRDSESSHSMTLSVFKKHCMNTGHKDGVPLATQNGEEQQVACVQCLNERIGSGK